MPNEIVPDGSFNFTGGQDASNEPDLIDQNKVAAAVNVTFESGKPRPRWALHERTLKFPPGGVTLPSLAIRDYASIFHSGRFQASAAYTVGSENYAIVIISGIIFAVNIRTYDVAVITIEGGQKLNELAPRVNWSYAGKYLVVFDYPAYPVIIDGFTARRADPAKYEIPISVLGTYNQNRLFVANAGNEFTGGDPSGNPATPNAPITFEEVFAPAATYLDQIFQLPSDYNNQQPITAMTFLQLADTSTGIGPLIVGTKDKIFAYLTQNPRQQWELGPFGSLFVFNAGIAGNRAFTHLNTNVYFISSDGELRSFSMSRDEQNRDSKLPMSREVRNWIKTTDKDLYYYSHVTYFKNKVFMSVNPYRVDALSQAGKEILDVAFGGYCVLELDNLSTLTQQGPPCWAGLWTGVRPMDSLVVNERLFVISKDGKSRNAFYEYVTSSTVDNVQGIERKIRSKIYTREYTFQNIFQEKELQTLDLEFRKIKGKFKVDVKYKVTHSEQYSDWGELKHFAPDKTCAVPQGGQILGFTPHSFKPQNIGAPVDNPCIEVTQEQSVYFRGIQFRLDIEGTDWLLSSLRCKARNVAMDETLPVCKEYLPVETYKQCDADWSIPDLSLCR